MSLPRVLFVDDEPNLLQGLRLSLRAKRHEWEMVFANDGTEALAELARQPCSVIVSDMRMPGLDGAQLLAQVAAQWPNTYRIILTGYAEQAALTLAKSAAHVCLNKPCELAELSEAIETGLRAPKPG